MAETKFQILGPLEVSRPADAPPIGPGKQRALLALLLIHRNHVVSIDRVIDELWGDEAPATAPKMVQNWVSQLRKSLANGDAPLLETVGRGYVLRAQDDDLDAVAFERLVDEGGGALAAGDPKTANERLRAALALWRGPALSDFLYERFAQNEAARLEERRLVALEQRIDADLALGRHLDVVAELDGLVAKYPLRERLRALQMLALYRCGRQADALHAYQDARRVLIEELGIEPGPELQRLQRAVLDHDADLAAPQRRVLAGSVPAANLRPLRAIGVGVLLIAIAAIGAGVLMHSGGSEPPLAAPNSLVRIDTEHNRVSVVAPVGRTPISLALGTAGSAWTVNVDDQTVTHVAHGGRQVSTFSTGSTPTAVASGFGSLWVATGGHSHAPGNYAVGQEQVVRLDPASRRVAAELTLPYTPGTGLRDPTGVTTGGGAVWALNEGGQVVRIDPDTNRVTGIVPRLRAKVLAWGSRALWVITADDDLARVDPAAARVTGTIKLAVSGADALAVGNGTVWVADSTDGTLWRIDVRRPRAIARTVSLGAGINAVAVGRAGVWVANGLRGTVVRVDPASLRRVVTIPVGSTPSGVVARGTEVWVAVQGAERTLTPTLTTRQHRLAALPASSCGPVMTGAKAPDLLIASDFPTQTPFERSLPAAVAFVLRERGFRAGRFNVGYQACDDSTPTSGGGDPAKCTDNAKQVASHLAVVGEIGPLDSGCAAAALPTLNRAPRGPVALVSPTNSSDDLTRPDAFGGHGNAPDSLYPTGVRNYARLYARETVQARADAAFVRRRLGATRVFVIEDDEPYGRGMAAKFTAAAHELGLHVVGRGRWNPATGRGSVLAAAARRARPDAVFLGSVLGLGGDKVVVALRRELGPKVALVAPDAFGPTWALWDMTHGAARGMYVSVPGTPNSRLGRRGRDFVRAFRGSQPRGVVGMYATATAAAAEALLDAIARSDGTRAGVTRQLLHTRLRDSAIGPVNFDRYGDITQSTVIFVRVERRDGATDIDGYDAGPVVALLHPR